VSAEETARAIRIRFVGRRWKLSFLEDLARELKSIFGEDATVRVNAFLVQNARLPLMDLDVIVQDVKVSPDEVRRKVEDVLMKHNYPVGRLLTVKEVTIRLPAAEQAQAPSEPGEGGQT
jgi:hypothetical protein